MARPVPVSDQENASSNAAWLRPPRFLSDGGEHRQATWLELFFDLVFVVTVAGMVSLLRDDLSLAGLATFAVLFVPTWWLWMDFSYYGDQFDTDDVVYRLALLTVMFLVLLTGKMRDSALHDAFSAAPAAFGAMYSILVGLYARAYGPNPELRPLIRRYLVAMSCACALFTLSAFVPPPWRFALWFVAIAVPMVNSPPTTREARPTGMPATSAVPPSPSDGASGSAGTPSCCPASRSGTMPSWVRAAS